MKIFFRFLLALLVVISSSCHSYRPVNFKKSTIKESLNIGDKIYVKTISGERIYLVVEKIDTEYISGNKGRIIKYSDIVAIERAEKNTKKTIGLVAIITGAVLVVAGIIYAFSHSSVTL